MDIDLDWQRRNGGELVRDALEKGKVRRPCSKRRQCRIPHWRNLI